MGRRVLSDRPIAARRWCTGEGAYNILAPGASAPSAAEASRWNRERSAMHDPVLLRDRPRPVQVVLGGVIPSMVGAVQGVLVGASATAYWVVAAIAAIGSVVSGFEHQDGWGGADRGVTAGAIYGTSLLLLHAIVGTSAKVSLGSFP